jgi:N-methylhydantoinase B
MNPIEIEVWHHLLQSIADEMGVALMRAALSPNIKERRDHSCALFDGDGRLLAQAAHIPVHLGSMALSVRAAIDAVPMAPGKQVLLNDPYAGGTHLPDLTLVKPVFATGGTTPDFYVANRAHHADVGGLTPGSLPLSSHIDQEGFRVGPTVLTEGVIDALCAASRTPEERRGDLAAQTAANRLGARRVRELVARHGLGTVWARGRELIEYTARLMRGVLDEIPDGTYRAIDIMNSDGLGNLDVDVAVSVTFDKQRCTIDFRDTADQVEGPINAVRAIALSAVFYVMRCLGPADMPTNAGCLEPIEVLTRPGSLVDALPPAPVAAGNVETSQRLVDVLLRALHQALPERIPAASAGSMHNVTIGSTPEDPAPPFVYYETIGGGAGAGPGWHGASGVHTHMTNTLNTPIEALEHAYPLTVTAYRLREGSGGAGRYRGGAGIVREYEFRRPAVVTTVLERHRGGPWGLEGGGYGAPARVTRIGVKGHEEPAPAKGTAVFEVGERLRIETAGGGGYGAEE